MNRQTLFPRVFCYILIGVIVSGGLHQVSATNTAVFPFGSQIIISSQADVALWVSLADVDGDQDLDVLSSSWADDKIAWYENLDGQGTFSSEQVISLLADGAIWVTPGDMDGDGDVDAVSASAGDDKIAWYENLDGQGTFGSQRIISIEADGAECVAIADLDNDGDNDVLSTSINDDRIAWYENLDGRGNFGPQHTISLEAYLPLMIYTADLDGDGDLDVLSASGDDDKIAWYENLDDSQTFGPQQVIWDGADIAFSVVTADLDNDGDLDVLSASAGDDKVAWYENLTGQGDFSAEQIISLEADGSMALDVGDIDLDGDIDAFSASADDDKIAWYENLDGQGTFGEQQVISTLADGPYSIAVGDADGDGDLDVFSASWIDDEIAWYENFRIGWKVFLPIVWP